MNYPKAIKTVAHRGAKALAPENSLLAFTTAAELGVAAIETDVRLTADGLPAIIHDSTLTRTHDHNAQVATTRMADLEALGVPPLSVMLDVFAADFDVIIDLKEKSRGLAEAVGRVVAESGRAQRCYVTGSDLSLLLRAQALAEGLRLSWTIGARHGTLTPAAVVEASVVGVSELAVQASEVSAELVAQAGSLGIDVRAYGIRTPMAARELVALGCTTLTLDDPRWAMMPRQLSLPLVSAAT
ncbi:MAG: glycerophosphodiester phosphodiesterase [Dehalococcoidia bacterium]|nr:glycerophosphodiester phosphodiesterase [Dehalococcoidia bacterium]